MTDSKETPRPNIVLNHEKKIVDYQEAIDRFRSGDESPLSSRDVKKLEKKLDKLKKKVYAELKPFERLETCRHPQRPKTLDYIRMICEGFFELYGDRAFADDAAIVGGLCRIGGQKFVVIGQEKGADTESRLHRNFGMAHPEGFRKALRLMKLAEKFDLPIVTFIDTAGAYAGLAAEERGQGFAIAKNLQEMMNLRTPVIVVLIGEAGSGGALAIAVGDRIGMLEHAYYSVISPEGCASILWKDASKKSTAADSLKINAEDMIQFGVIDCVIKEPLGGAHHDEQMIGKHVFDFILSSWHALKTVPIDALLEQRYQKFRQLGRYTE